MSAPGYVKIGRIVKTFGYKGELKILMDIEVSDLFDEEGFGYEAFFLFKKDQPLPYFIEDVRTQNEPNHLIVKFEDIDNKEEAQLLAGKDIFLSENDIEINEEEGNFSHLIGYTFFDMEGKEIGALEDIYMLPMQELGVIIYKGKEVLLPLNEETVQEVIQKDNKVLYNLPEGLLDIYLEQ